MNAALIASFADELEKDAAVPKLLQSLWRSGAGRALAGGAVGAGTGALADPENRLRGAILGGALGAGGGYAAPLLTRAGRRRAKQHVKHLGAKTKYEVTGRGRAPIAPTATKEQAKEIRKLEQAGLLSVPGALKGLATKPLQTMKGAWKHSGGVGKAMAVGDVAMGVPHVLDASTQQGTGEKALGTLGSAGGYLLGGRMGMLGSMALGSGLGYLGGRAGRLFGGGKPESGATNVAQQAAKGNLRPAVGALEQATTRPSTVFAKQQLAQAVPEVGRLVGPG
jgi:hypothetical protein